MTTGLSIGAAAQRSGCSVATIRYYEEIGLMPRAQRSAGGRRVYGAPDLARLRLIRRLRTMEIGIEAVRALVGAFDARAPACTDVRDLALAHLATVRARRAELEALERTLASLAASCDATCGRGAPQDCAIIEDLAGA